MRFVLHTLTFAKCNFMKGIKGTKDISYVYGGPLSCWFPALIVVTFMYNEYRERDNMSMRKWECGYHIVLL